jgi:hypothetical protein
MTDAIAPRAVVGGLDAAGVHVESVAEAVMGVTAGLMAIASAIERVAEAIAELPTGNIGK